MGDNQHHDPTDGLAMDRPEGSPETDHTTSDGVPRPPGPPPPATPEGVPSSPDGEATGNRVTQAPVPAAQQRPRRLKPTETALVTVWLIAVTGAAILALLSLWPVAEQVRQASLRTAGAAPATTTQLHLVLADPVLTPDMSIILIGMLSGLLGSLVHTLTWLNQSSRSPTATGRRKAHRTHDVVWFVTAPIQGALLAFLVICAGAAGLLSAGQGQATTTVSLFTVAAVGGLTGLFSRRMTAKLAQIVSQVAPRSSTTPSTGQAPTTSTTDTGASTVR